MQGLRLHKKRIYSLALDIYVTHPQLDYEDALIVAHMQDAGMNEVVTYDRDFDRIPGVLRAEPIP
jgi:predicted nucleic acid-binding protein